MPFIAIDRNERWPDYSVNDEPDPKWDTIVEVEQSKLDEWQRVRIAYNAMQDELEKLYKTVIKD